MAKKDECPCMNGVVKIQARNILVSWYNRENETVAQLEKKGDVPKVDIENKRIVLDAIKNEIERIDDTPECEEPMNDQKDTTNS